MQDSVKKIVEPFQNGSLNYFHYSAIIVFRLFWKDRLLVMN